MEPDQGTPILITQRGIWRWIPSSTPQWALGHLVGRPSMLLKQEPSASTGHTRLAAGDTRLSHCCSNPPESLGAEATVTVQGQDLAAQVRMLQPLDSGQAAAPSMQLAFRRISIAQNSTLVSNLRGGGPQTADFGMLWTRKH